MLCDECHKELATVHVTRIVNGEKSEFHLCSECAGNHHDAPLSMKPGSAFHNILAGLFEQEGSPLSAVASKSGVRCENCGLSLNDFRRIGRLGCSHCYEQFRPALLPLLKRIHRSTGHVGKRPDGPSEAVKQRRKIESLNKALKDAIAREAFEEAASLRDEIKNLNASQS